MVNEQYKSIIVGLMIFSLLVSINLGGRRSLKKYTEIQNGIIAQPVSYTHLRAHET